MVFDLLHGDTEILSSPDTDMMLDMPDDPFTKKGKGHRCSWPDYDCDSEVRGRILEPCDDPDCKRSHSNDYCIRHYAVRLGLMLDELRDSHDMREASTPDDVRLTTLKSLSTVWHEPVSAHPSSDASDVLHEDEKSLEKLIREEHKANEKALSKLGINGDDACEGTDGGVSGMRMCSFVTVSESGMDGLQAWLDGIRRECGVGFHVSGVAGRRYQRYSKTKFDNAKRGMIAAFIRDEDGLSNGNGRVFRTREHWSSEYAGNFEDEGGFSPYLGIRRDIIDNHLTEVRASDCLYSVFQKRFRTVTDDVSRMSDDGVFILIPDDSRMGVMMPFTSGSRLTWTSDEGGMMMSMSIGSELLHLSGLMAYSSVISDELDDDVMESVAELEESRWRRYAFDGIKEEPVGYDRILTRAELSYDGMVRMLAEYDRRFS